MNTLMFFCWYVGKYVERCSLVASRLFRLLADAQGPVRGCGAALRPGLSCRCRGPSRSGATHSSLAHIMDVRARLAPLGTGTQSPALSAHRTRTALPGRTKSLTSPRPDHSIPHPPSTFASHAPTDGLALAGRAAATSTTPTHAHQPSTAMLGVFGM